MDNKSVQEAIQIIGQNKDKVSMLVKKEGGGTVSLPANRFRSPESKKSEGNVFFFFKSVFNSALK